VAPPGARPGRDGELSAEPPERWARIEEIVDRALDLPAADRAAFVRSACGGDTELLAAVERWLAACEAPTLVPDTSAAAFAAPFLEDLLSEQGAPAHEHGGPVRRIGAYRIVQEIGRGGMGTVFLAERDDGQFTRRVALKVMKRGAGGDPQLRRRFLEERQILARLEHPHIATLLDGGVTEDGQPFFVMQYVEGAPIDRFSDERALTIEARLGVFLDVCDAVQHAHAQHVVHRDLKPSNILVAADGNAKLLDFGIAKLLEDAADEGQGLTRTGERLLTPEYASPEQVRGDPVTAASDVYSLGVVLHELLTGRLPYRTSPRTPHEVERAVLEEEPTLPSAAVTGASPLATPRRRPAASPEEISQGRSTSPGRLRRRLRGDLDTIVLRALQKDPVKRYADAGELAADLRRHVAGHPIHARSPGPAHRVAAFARRHRVSIAAAGAGLAAGAALLALGGGPRRSFGIVPGSAETAQPVLAIGRIADYRDGHEGETAAPLIDMLATNLARTSGLAVISSARMLELVQQAPAGAQVSDEGYARAARLAGATQLLDGAIYSTAGGELRLDLRRIDVATGSIAGAQSAAGVDLFALADGATLRLVAELGLIAPPGSIADVTTHSLAAYQHYTEGLRHFYARNQAAADSAFQAALREDSTFALAAYFNSRNRYYFWRSPSATAAEREAFDRSMAQALRLSERSSDRERLMLRAWYAVSQLSPDMRAVAETLVVRYPHEIDGYLAMGSALGLQGDMLGAIPYFRRVLEMDSASLRVDAATCHACEAISMVVEAYAVLDSLDAAEREARQWLRIQPSSPEARRRLADILDAQGRFGEAAALLASGRDMPASQDSTLPLAKHWIRAGDVGRADTTVARWIRETAPGPERAGLLLLRVVALRNLGRLREALQEARRLRAETGDPIVGDAAPPSALLEAQVLFDLGRYRDAQALFDSIARWPAQGQPPSVQATFRVTAVTMSAASRHASGDTTRLAELADSLERDGALAFMFRPRDQHLYVRGLLLAARGDDDASIRSLQAGLRSATTDFGRVNLELARLFLRGGRPADAVQVLRPLVRGWFMESTNLHNTLTEVHEMLGQAWDQAGVPDSAAVHWRRVASAWERADPELQPRRAYAEGRLSPPP
jgi:serine/threonine protein kinase/tetratricopeptide (TPR) repeat protein